MDDSHDGTSRRRFLGMAGAVTASAALMQAMTGAAPAHAVSPWAGDVKLPRDAGNGQTVLILGAGISGLTAAYELAKAGYQVQILEAQGRPGGRSFTARPGTEFAEIGGEKQVCRFDKGLYLNLGPGRLPYHHRRVLRYCSTLGVALEPYIMRTGANLYQHPDAFGGKPQPYRRVANDARGYYAQHLIKSLQKGPLKDDVDPARHESLHKLLRHFGDLKDSDQYFGSTRSDYRADPEIHQNPTEAADPLEFDQLIAAELWNNHFFQPDDRLWQHTMFQPVGGMDKIVEGFLRKVGDLVTYDAPVTRIALAEGGGVEVTWCHDGATETRRVDHCLSSIPLVVLNGLELDGFSDEFRRAVRTPKFTAACKVGWQANERFWESDEYQIYGGISWLKHVIYQVWYPSNDYFSDKGTLTGAYCFGTAAEELGGLSLPDRLARAREGGRRLHDEFDNNAVVPDDLGLSIAWHKMPYQLGGWVNWRGQEPEHAVAYQRLLGDDGGFQVIGDQISPLPGWQEGAMMSAEWAVARLTGAHRGAIPTVRHAPDSETIAR